MKYRTKRKILIVDDDELLVEGLVEILKDQYVNDANGIGVRFDSEPKLMTQIAKGNYGSLVLGIVMTAFSGWNDTKTEVFRRRKIRPHRSPLWETAEANYP